MSYIILVSGGPGTGKSTFAIPEDLAGAYFEFDPGSYRRATDALPPSRTENVTLHKFYAPLTNLLNLGKVNVGQTGGVGSAATQHLEGWRELYVEFVDAYLKALASDIDYITFDTETREWLLVRQAWLQQVQEAQLSNNKQEADRLGTLQYTETNARQAQLMDAARLYDKHLILLSHTKEEWKGDKATGRMIHDGHKESPGLADLYLNFELDGHTPVATILKAGAGGLDLIGMKLTAPTLTGVIKLLDSAALVRRSGMELPETPEDIIMTAEALG